MLSWVKGKYGVAAGIGVGRYRRRGSVVRRLCSHVEIFHFYQFYKRPSAPHYHITLKAYKTMASFRLFPVLLLNPDTVPKIYLYDYFSSAER